nr:sugar ABC transporter ATP-binding protein [Ruegeria atlantica]
MKVHPGRVHVLLGENGAGKSTLLKTLVAAVKQTSGRITFEGEAFQAKNVQEAMACGVVPVYQHLSLFPNLSVHENLSAFALAEREMQNVRRCLIEVEQAKASLLSVGLSVPLDTLVGSLSIGERQLVEIARAVGQNCKLLILDEPTSALTSTETDKLFSIVRDLCAQGTAVLFVSHKMDEVAEIADDVSVLCDGRTVVDCVQYSDTNESELLEAMLNAPVTSFKRQLPVHSNEIVLRAEGLKVSRNSNVSTLHAKKGEIVGLAGLVGSGALSIAEALAGARQISDGRITINDVLLMPGDRAEATKKGVGYVPGDRQTHGLFPILPALTNASASLTKQLDRFGFLKKNLEIETFEPWMEKLKLLPFDFELPATQFSGGNQQKIIVARNVALPHLSVLVLLEPTRGVDVRARQFIHDTIVEAAQSGATVIIASTDLDEVLSLSHRTYVIKDHCVCAQLTEGATRQCFIDALFSQSERAVA